MPEPTTPWDPPDERAARELLRRARQKARREQARQARIAVWTRSLMAHSPQSRRPDRPSARRPSP